MERKSKENKFGIMVKSIVFNDKQHVLLLKKEDEWDLPGGALRFGENVYNAAWRTTKELTDLDTDIIKPSNVWTFKTTDHLHKVCVTFAASWIPPKDDDDPILLANDYKDFAWVKPRDIINGHYPVWMKDEIRQWKG